jgi:hypothetical protein
MDSAELNRSQCRRAGQLRFLIPCSQHPEGPRPAAAVQYNENIRQQSLRLHQTQGPIHLVPQRGNKHVQKMLWVQTRVLYGQIRGKSCDAGEVAPILPSSFSFSLISFRHFYSSFFIHFRLCLLAPPLSHFALLRVSIFIVTLLHPIPFCLHSGARERAYLFVYPIGLFMVSIALKAPCYKPEGRWFDTPFYLFFINRA